MTTLVVAAGGGGDALGVMALCDLLPELDQVPLIATFAWERLRIDPVPGPRGFAGFTDLGLVGDRQSEITGGTDTLPPGRSSLPRLARESGSRLFLLDPSSGAMGLARQLKQLCAALGAERILVVDIGGDAIALGTEPGIQSPLADALALQSAASVDLPGRVVIAGPGLDGELSEAETLHRVHLLGGSLLGRLDASSVANVMDVLGWHPSEVSALLVAAALGHRGNVEIRRGEAPVPLTDQSPTAWSLDLARVVAGNQLAHALRNTTSLDAADQVARRISVSELDYERAKAERLSDATEDGAHPPMDLASRASRPASEALARGFDFITTRRLAEIIGLPGGETERLVTVLQHMPGAQCGPIWDLRSIVNYGADARVDS